MFFYTTTEINTIFAKMKNNPDFVKVFSFNKLYYIEMVQAFLKDNGIEAFVLNQKYSSYNFGEIELLVKKDDKPKALELIKTFENNEK